MTGEPVFMVDHLAVALDGKAIIRGLTFTLGPGESMAIIGPNGAGKSTLLKAMLRLVPVQAGKIELFGRDIRSYSRRALARMAGYVPQAGGSVFPFTVEEFVLMARYPYLTPFSHFTGTDRREAQQAMEQAEVASFAGRQLHTLSGGERQKVFIAAALAQRPRIMLLDEATAFLDYRHQAEVIALIEKLRRDAGLAVVSVTHDLNQGALNQDKVLALKEGRMAFFDTPGALLEENRLEAIYDTPFRLLTDPGTGRIIVTPGDNGP